MKLFKWAFFALSFTLIFTSCDKDEEEQTEPTSDSSMARIEFEHTWGMMADHFHLDDWFVQPMTQDSMRFSDVRYFVTDIELTDIDGNVWEEDESYYLIDIADHMNGGHILDIDNVPTGDYVSISFLLGVDSAKVTEGAQPGILAPGDMFWSWNSGYKFLVMEGESPDAVQNAGAFVFHLGGWKAPNVASVRKTIDFEGQIMEVRRDATPKVHVNVNMAHIWHDGTDLGQRATVHMPGAAAKEMMMHFSHSMTLDHLHN